MAEAGVVRLGLSRAPRCVLRAANIAEGHSRRGTKEYRHFLNIALGSMGEMQYVIRCARDLGYVAPEAGAELDRLSDEAGRRLWRLFQGVDRKLATDPR